MFLRSGFPFNYDTNAEGDQSALKCEDESLARQSAFEESDINTIVKRFGLTGQLPVGVRAPVFQDFEGVFDFQSAMDSIIGAERAFMALPADVRRRFGNDPQELVVFVSDEGNRAEAEKLGLVVPPKVEVVPAPLAVRVVQDDVVVPVSVRKDPAKPV